METVGWVMDFMAEIIAKAGERSKKFQNTVRKASGRGEKMLKYIHERDNT